jgi:AraC-like DNA-binding protein
LKARLPLKALWLLTFLFFSILLSIQPSRPEAIILPLSHSTRNANLAAQELDRNYTIIQTRENDLRDAVLTGPMELLEEESRLGDNSGRLYAEHLAYALTMPIVSLGTGRDCRRSSPNVLSPPRLRRVIERMHAALSSEIDLKTLAIESGYGRNHFLRMFWETTAHTPHQYLLRLRDKRDQELMKNRSIPLMDIALQCGFASHSHLSRVFRQIVGETLSKFGRETSEHFPASLVRTVVICMKVVNVGHWRGKSMNSNSLIDEESKQPPNPSTDDLFSLRFLHCRSALFYIACRVLDGEQGAEEAVHNGFRVGSRTAREFTDEGIFRGWILRGLIDEALLIRHRRDEVKVGKRCIGTNANLECPGDTRTSDILCTGAG